MQLFRELFCDFSGQTGYVFVKRKWKDWKFLRACRLQYLFISCIITKNYGKTQRNLIQKGNLLSLLMAASLFFQMKLNTQYVIRMWLKEEHLILECIILVFTALYKLLPCCRFSAENKAKMKPCQFMPFGFGPRICIGKRLAITEMKIALAKLLREFILVKCDKTKVGTREGIGNFKKKEKKERRIWPVE